MDVPLDKVGKWSELKLEIFKKYVRAYTTILGAKGRKLKYIYIDAFAGAGECISKETGSATLWLTKSSLFRSAMS